MDRLSGGERRRVSLAAALVAEAELLVLDEPTNHLDVEAVSWLAEYLGQRRSALLVVTHDRWFLDAVCSRTWEVADGAVHGYDGGYAAYVLARAERSRQASASEARRQNLLRKELAWLRRGPPARTSKPKFRIDAAEALIADVPTPRAGLELRALAARRLGRTVYELADVSLSVGNPPRRLLDRVSWQVGPGDRIGVIGVNGSGKTHLLRLLTGELRPDAGRVVIGQTVRAGYLSQHVPELPAGLRVIEAITEIRNTAVIDGVEQSASQLAERFGFANQRQWTRVAELSGGERRRLQLLRVLLGQPNVLLLDEPTNDLDTDTLAELEDLLDSWPGSLVVVSHDRYLIERICDSTVALLGDGSLAALPGGIEQYLQLRADGRQRPGLRPTVAERLGLLATVTDRAGRPTVAGRPACRRGRRAQAGSAGRPEGTGAVGTPARQVRAARGRTACGAGRARHRLRQDRRAERRTAAAGRGAGRDRVALVGAVRPALTVRSAVARSVVGLRWAVEVRSAVRHREPAERHRRDGRPGRRGSSRRR